MSYSVEPRRLKKLVDFYYADNNFEEIKYMKAFGGEEGLLRHLETSPFQGIDSTSIQQRKLEFGVNEVWAKTGSKSICQILILPLKQFSPKITFIFSIISLLLGIFFNDHHIQLPWIEGIAFIFFFLVTYIITVIPEIQIEQSNTQLKQFNQVKEECIVWRDNQKIIIPIHDLVVGDVVELQKGEYVGADGLMIEGQVKVREKIGHFCRKATKKTKRDCIESVRLILSKKKFIESTDHSEKPSPILLGGSTVLQGEGRMLVLCVGRYSQQGYRAGMIIQSAKRKTSNTYDSISLILFEFSKYYLLCLILQLFLYCAKQTLFIIINQSLQTTDWIELVQNLCCSLTLILTGLPHFVIIGLSIGLLFIRMGIWKVHGIHIKYSRDCDKIKDCATIIYQQHKMAEYYSLKRWWNEDFQNFIDFKIIDLNYRQLFLKSLQFDNFQPFEFGIDLPSLFVGLNNRQIKSIQSSLVEFYESHANLLNQVESSSGKRSEIDIKLEEIEGSDSSQSAEKLSNKYFVGNAQTILKLCTHYCNHETGIIQALQGDKRSQIQKIIWKNNLNSGLSLINGFVEVNPEHPRYREGNSKIVMIALLQFDIHENGSEFSAFLNIKKRGFNFLLVSSEDQQTTISKAKQIGIIVVGKPSVNLKGHDFNNLTGGILCKSCKKSVCICASELATFDYVIKHQDEFATIQKHLCTIAEADMLEKLGLVLGIKNSDSNNACFFGSKIQDIPAMKSAELAFCVQGFCDKYAYQASQIVLKTGKLSEIFTLINLSSFTFLFYKKYLTLFLTASIVAFSSNMISFLFFDTDIIKLIHFLWVSVFICPILGITFSFTELMGVQQDQDYDQAIISDNPSSIKIQSIEKQEKTFRTIQKNREEDKLINKSDSRLIASQSIFQTFLLMMVLLFGQYFIHQATDSVEQLIGDDWSAKYNDETKSTVCWGVKTNVFAFGKSTYNQIFDNYGIHSRHLTFIFSLYVLMQFMNFFLCRVCHKTSLNLFEGMSFKSLILIIATFGCQVLCVQVSSSYFGLYPNGLTLIQWVICFGLSISVCIFGVVVKQIPVKEENIGKQIFKIWPNRAYNLAVKAVAPRQDFIDFQIDDDFELEQKIKEGHED